MYKFLTPALLAASLTGNPVAAQEEAAPTDPIVVEGTREEVRTQIRNILEPSGGQLSSFGRGFCPVIIGFDAEWSAILDGYIRENAEKFGLKPKGEKCSPTAIVVFTDEPQKLVQGLRKKMPRLFASHYLPEIRRITETVRPAYSWRVTGEVGRDGAMPSSASLDGNPNGVPVINAFSASRLYSATNYEIFNAWLVVDINKTPGMSLRQIADFATMNLLLDLDEEAVSKAPDGSILELFHAEDPSTVSPGFSTFDEGLLAGLYGAENKSRTASQQSATIARSMTRTESEDEQP